MRKAMVSPLAAIGMALAFVAAPAARAAVPLYSGLYVFGDSLVDSGNARIGSALMGLPEQASPNDGYFAGRFSNGYNFADYLGFRIGGQPANAYLAGGTNYAVGGAVTVNNPASPSQGFPGQLAIFGAPVKPIDSNALVLVTFGGNDVRATAGIGGPVDFTLAQNTLKAGLLALVASGAQHILVTGLPDISKLPSAQPLAAIPNRLQELQDRSSTLNGDFEATASLVASLTGVDVDFFDLFSFEDDEVLANPAAFGLTNVTTSCQKLGAGLSGQPCAGSLYFDGIHPTTQVHQDIAYAISRQLGLVPESATWTMLIAGFGMIGVALRRRHPEELAARA